MGAIWHQAGCCCLNKYYVWDIGALTLAKRFWNGASYDYFPQEFTWTPPENTKIYGWYFRGEFTNLTGNAMWANELNQKFHMDGSVPWEVDPVTYELISHYGPGGSTWDFGFQGNNGTYEHRPDIIFQREWNTGFPCDKLYLKYQNHNGSFDMDVNVTVIIRTRPFP